MFIQTNERRIISLKDIRSIYVEKMTSNLYVIYADDFDGHTYCVYPGSNEEDADNRFWEIVDEIEGQGLLIES